MSVDRLIVICDSSEDKKGSVRFFPSGDSVDVNGKPAFDSIYINRTFLGKPTPKIIRVTIEEVL